MSALDALTGAAGGSALSGARSTTGGTINYSAGPQVVGGGVSTLPVGLGVGLLILGLGAAGYVAWRWR